MFKKSFSPFISSLLSLLFLVVSCTDNPSDIGGTPPELPPASSMNMDFSTFQNSQKLEYTTVQSADNFGRAVSVALVLKAVVDANLAIPKLLFAAASKSNVKAQLNDNEKWEWSYTKTASSNTYSVRLVASREGNDMVTWECYVTNTKLGLDNQLFFKGTANSNATQGTWTYYNLQNTNSQEEISQISWAVKGQNDVSLKLVVASDRNGYKGDYIKYAFDGSVKTASYYDAGADETTKLQVNVDTHAGFIKSPNYNNGMQSCWDDNLKDTACS